MVTIQKHRGFEDGAPTLPLSAQSAKVLEVLGGTFEVGELDRPAMSKPASVGHWCPLVANRKKVTHT